MVLFSACFSCGIFLPNIRCFPCVFLIFPRCICGAFGFRIFVQDTHVSPRFPAESSDSSFSLKFIFLLVFCSSFGYLLLILMYLGIYLREMWGGCIICCWYLRLLVFTCGSERFRKFRFWVLGTLEISALYERKMAICVFLCLGVYLNPCSPGVRR